ncbi:transferase [Kitasatospora sp. NPDC092948]|uniref:transferase n=1 Tax=Kitasatospora sp. NPDC092948 TaxID=3364088 RepID=UPI0037FF58FC
MPSGRRTLARLITSIALIAAYIALHVAITAAQDVRTGDRFRDGPARAAAFAVLVDRFANGEQAVRADIVATRQWFEENAPPGHARDTVSTTVDLVGRGDGPAARARAATLRADVERDRAALRRAVGTEAQVTLWLSVGAAVLAVSSLKLRRQRLEAAAEAARTVSRFAERQPWWRRPLFLTLSSTGYGLFTAGYAAVSTAQRTGYKQSVTNQLVMLPVGLAALGVGFLVLRYARPRSARPAARALQADGRRPVLYLRSFADDGTAARIDDWQPLNIHSREEQLATALAAFGPVIAVGRPGEPLPLLGAARFYLPLDDWKPTILRLMDLSRLIVLRVGTGEGLRWEIEQAVATQPAGKLVLLTPGRVGDAVNSTAGRLPVPLRLEEVAADTSWISAAVTFGADWTPHVRAIEPVPGTEPPRGGLRRAFGQVRAVFWQPSPARRTARAMKDALAQTGVRGRMFVLRSDSNPLATLGKGAVAIAVLAVPYRLLDLAALW